MYTRILAEYPVYTATFRQSGFTSPVEMLLMESIDTINLLFEHAEYARERRDYMYTTQLLSSQASMGALLG